MSATSRRRSSGDRSRARAALTSQSMQDLTQFKVAVDEEHCDDGAAEATLLLQKKPSPIRPHTQSLGHRRNRSSDLSFLRQEKLSLPQMPASPNGSPSLTRRMSKSLLELSQSVDNLAVETPSPVVRRRSSLKPLKDCVMYVDTGIPAFDQEPLPQVRSRRSSLVPSVPERMPAETRTILAPIGSSAHRTPSTSRRSSVVGAASGVDDRDIRSDDSTEEDDDDGDDGDAESEDRQMFAAQGLVSRPHMQQQSTTLLMPDALQDNVSPSAPSISRQGSRKRSASAGAMTQHTLEHVLQQGAPTFAESGPTMQRVTSSSVPSIASPLASSSTQTFPLATSSDLALES
eukprot:m.264066 g.264066  ORF g.264066 m.264066 type:complete len:345 (+) comp15609_c1_seq4:367-1401(+)